VEEQIIQHVNNAQLVNKANRSQTSVREVKTLSAVVVKHAREDLIKQADVNKAKILCVMFVQLANKALRDREAARRI